MSIDGIKYSRSSSSFCIVTREYDLRSRRNPVHNFGRPEAQLILEEIMTNTTSSGSIIALQTGFVVDTALATTLRPGSLAGSCKQYREDLPRVCHRFPIFHIHLAVDFSFTGHSMPNFGMSRSRVKARWRSSSS